ncbi:MAG: HAD-IIIC family phosphatase [Lachnospiraceae bacterium]|nr:HAD-IIIC family phosphatase [Lachnospiraceae bacterium]
MKTARMALLSNVNMNFVIRLLKRQMEIYEAEGYGNELGLLMNPASSYHTFAPAYTFLVMDLMELLEHELEEQTALERVNNWFDMLESSLADTTTYYVSDAYLWGVELDVLVDKSRKQTLEQLWMQRLQRLCAEHTNVRIFPYRHLVEQMGEGNVFSPKMWYMGRILLSNDAQKRLCEAILACLEREQRVAKKVLLLDLDNTLWGGLAGEAEQSPIVLSEEHEGLAYKNLQRVILHMQRQGVLLAIVSKNNEEDALEIIRSHPHMLLREECFAAKRINWQGKHENILEIAKELNLGTDSFVFWDDNPSERELVRKMLPEVIVPDFPQSAEELAPCMAEIYEQYFAKPVLTQEDRDKTEQYAANAKRGALQKAAHSFEEYLKQLELVITRVNPAAHVERLTQMANKTNQFNLTTRRYTLQEMQEILQDENREVYLYNVADRFGDNGLVAMVIVHFPEGSEDVPVVEEFVMSCRVMGKQIENAVLQDVEQSLREAGCTKLKGIYLPTAKNKPVEMLYPELGYTQCERYPKGGAAYLAELNQVPARPYQAKVLKDATLEV